MHVCMYVCMQVCVCKHASTHACRHSSIHLLSSSSCILCASPKDMIRMHDTDTQTHTNAQRTCTRTSLHQPFLFLHDTFQGRFEVGISLINPQLFQSLDGSTIYHKTYNQKKQYANLGLFHTTFFFTCKEHISMSFFVGFPSHFGLTHHSQRMHVHSPLSESTLRTCSLNTQALSSGPCLTQMSMRAPNSALPVHVCVCMQYVCACIGCMECMYVAKYVRMHVYV